MAGMWHAAFEPSLHGLGVHLGRLADLLDADVGGSHCAS
jgi:hypothetical protein